MLSLPNDEIKEFGLVGVSAQKLRALRLVQLALVWLPAIAVLHFVMADGKPLSEGNAVISYPLFLLGAVTMFFLLPYPMMKLYQGLHILPRLGDK